MDRLLFTAIHPELCSKQHDEFLNGDRGATDDSPEASSVELPVIRNREVSSVRMIKNDVASPLAVKNETDLLECLDCLTAREDGKRRHSGYAATLISTISGEGMGNCCALRTSRIPSIAS